jgi:hypothetical protein
MQKKKQPAGVPDPDDQVKLKPILGIRPGVYLAVIYSIALLALFFYIFLYPGIVNPGSMVVFESIPSGAALRVDGVYAGSSPCRVFVPKGTHTFDIVLPGFEPRHMEHEVPGRLFASRLFPRRYNVQATLHTADPMAALAEAAHDYAMWSFGGEPTVSWQVPLSLSEGVYRIGPAAAGAEAAGILAAASRYAVTRAALRDLLRAKTLAANGGLPPSPLSLGHSLSDIFADLSDGPSGALWLADTLPADSAEILVSSAWYQNQLAAFAELTAMESLSPQGHTPVSQIRVGGLLFTGLDGGNLVQGEPFPHLTQVEPFMMCAAAVPVPAYEDFLDANPRWRANQREELVRQGLATGEYLADFGGINPGGSRGFTSISAVSWFAAKAFCEWLSGRLPDALAGWEVRLPTEAEWEYAVKSIQQWGSRSSFQMDGITWEWCADPYSPLPFISASPDAIAAVGSPERVVRGGSWPGMAVAANFETRAGLPPETCSPFVSFRPVIARKP